MFIIEFLLVCGVDELVELKAGFALIIDPVIEGRQHLIFPLLIEGIKIDRGVLLPESLFLIFQQRAEQPAPPLRKRSAAPETAAIFFCGIPVPPG